MSESVDREQRGERKVAVELIDSLAELKMRHPALWADDHRVDVFLTAQWFEILAASGMTRSDAKLLLLTIAGESIPLCLPLSLPAGPAGRLGFQQTTGIHGFSNFYASLFGFVAMPEDTPQRVDHAVLLGAAIWRLPGSSVVTLQPLALDQPFMLGMENALRRGGYWVDRFFCFGNWYLPSAGLDFERYLATRGSQLRNNITRGKRRLSKAGNWEIEIADGATPLASRLRVEFESVYGASWKEAEARPEFIQRLMQLAAECGWLRLGVLRLNGQAIAAQLWLVKAGRASIYKLAYREGQGSFSAGSILTAALMQRVLDVDRVTEVDYLTGDDEYKKDWMTHRRERWGVVAFHPWRLTGLIAAARHFGGGLLRRAVK